MSNELSVFCARNLPSPPVGLMSESCEKRDLAVQMGHKSIDLIYEAQCIWPDQTLESTLS